MGSDSLAEKVALVIGAGGLGAPALLVLASSGVGKIVVVDDDAVETSNLARQVLFGEADLGERKAVAAARRLARLFPAVAVEALDRRFDEASAPDLVGRADVVVDGSDNFPTKFLANDAAVAAGKVLVHGGLLRFTAQLLTVVPGTTGCLRCLFEAPPPPGTVPSCAEAGVLGPLAGFAGSLMGAEALRVLSGERGTYAGRLLVYEARGAQVRTVPVRLRPGCPACAALPKRSEPEPAGEVAAAPAAAAATPAATAAAAPAASAAPANGTPTSAAPAEAARAEAAPADGSPAAAPRPGGEP
jgi:molybdopterin-synthase adenylyltransferase